MNLSHRKPEIRFRFALLLIGLIATQPAMAFDAIYAFGDSLTDTGNEPAPAVGYFQGRYSNGPLWIEHLSTRLGFAYAATNNFAQSGGETSDALAQVQNFARPQDPSGALFVVWAGGNDFIHNFSQGLNEMFWNSMIAQSVANISNAVNILYADGARAIMVPNLVDLSRLPLVLDSGLPSLPILQAYLRGKVDRFNSSLAAALAAIESSKPDLQLISPDVHLKFNDVLSDPAANGFTRTAPDALTDPQLTDKTFAGPGKDYLFWDPIHPTTKAHALVAQWFYSAQPQQPRLGIVASGGGVQLILSDLQVGHGYTLQTSANLVAWSDSATVNATNSVQPWAIPSGTSAPAFFRLKE